MSYAIEVKNVTKEFGAKTVLNQVSMQVKKGSIFGFLGRNGAGKSTLVNIMTGISFATKGSVHLLGEPLPLSSAVQRKIGVMPDYSMFYEDMTALQHLRYFAKLLKFEQPNAYYMNLLKQVGLEDAAHVKTKKFSFGMKKKLGIAQALVNAPELIFLDEPTSGVDADSILGIHEIIRNLAKKGTTVFLTSHNLDEVEKLCDEVAIMENGVVRSQGTLEELRTRFQPTLEVTMKHAQASKDSKAILSKLIANHGEILDSSPEHFTFTLQDDTMIPVITRAFAQMKIDVYRIEVNEPSLEEIFLDVASSQ